MRNLRKLFLGLSVLLCVSLPAQASPLQYVMPDYYLGHIVRGLLKVASKTGFPQYQVLSVPHDQKKAQQALAEIYKAPAFNYTYDHISVVIIRGVEGEPNAFSFGSNIFVTQSLVEALNTTQLTAVLAHELAHSEKAHHLQKAPLPLEATVYQLVTVTKSLKAGKWPRGKDLLASIQELMNTGSLAMELQADCIAAQQLEYMKSKGLPHAAKDLISATNALMGMDMTQDHSDDPSAVRVQALVNKTYLDGSCDIF